MDAMNNTTTRTTNQPAAAASAAAPVTPATPPAATQPEGGQAAPAAQTKPAVPGWTAQLKDELKTNEKLAKFATVGELCTAFLALDGGPKDVIPLLPDNATEQQKAEFYQKLGCPKTPEEYALDKAAIPNWGPADDVLEAAMRPQLHKMGLSQQQYAGLVNAFSAFNAQMAEANRQATQEAMTAMTAKYGDKSQAVFETVARAADKVGGADLKALLETVDVDGVKLGNHPIFVEAFYKLAPAVLEDGYVAGGNAAPVGGGDGLLDYSK